MRVNRDEFLHEAVCCLAAWYRWGGKSPNSGIDCSGVVTWSLYKAGGPDLRQTHNTDALWAELPSTQTPVPGDLAFYGGRGADDVSHVMVCLWKRHDGVWAVLGATRGGRDTTSIAIAAQQDARVRVKRSHLYRSDFRGFKSMELYLKNGGTHAAA